MMDLYMHSFVPSLPPLTARIGLWQGLGWCCCKFSFLFLFRSFRPGKWGWLRCSTEGNLTCIALECYAIQFFLQPVMKFSWTVTRRDARGSRDGGFWGANVAQWTMEKALASHQCGLSSNPGNDTIIRQFFCPSTPVFLSLKTNIC